MNKNMPESLLCDPDTISNKEKEEPASKDTNAINKSPNMDFSPITLSKDITKINSDITRLSTILNTLTENDTGHIELMDIFSQNIKNLVHNQQVLENKLDDLLKNQLITDQVVNNLSVKLNDLYKYNNNVNSTPFNITDNTNSKKDNITGLSAPESVSNNNALIVSNNNNNNISTMNNALDNNPVIVPTGQVTLPKSKRYFNEPKLNIRLLSTDSTNNNNINNDNNSNNNNATLSTTNATATVTAKNSGDNDDNNNDSNDTPTTATNKNICSGSHNTTTTKKSHRGPGRPKKFKIVEGSSNMKKSTSTDAASGTNANINSKKRKNNTSNSVTTSNANNSINKTDQNTVNITTNTGLNAVNLEGKRDERETMLVNMKYSDREKTKEFMEENKALLKAMRIEERKKKLLTPSALSMSTSTANKDENSTEARDVVKDHDALSGDATNSSTPINNIGATKKHKHIDLDDRIRLFNPHLSSPTDTITTTANGVSSKFSGILNTNLPGFNNVAASPIIANTIATSSSNSPPSPLPPPSTTSTIMTITNNSINDSDNNNNSSNSVLPLPIPTNTSVTLKNNTTSSGTPTPINHTSLPTKLPSIKAPPLTDVSFTADKEGATPTINSNNDNACNLPPLPTSLYHKRTDSNNSNNTDNGNNNNLSYIPSVAAMLNYDQSNSDTGNGIASTFKGVGANNNIKNDTHDTMLGKNSMTVNTNDKNIEEPNNTDTTQNKSDNNKKIRYDRSRDTNADDYEKRLLKKPKLNNRDRSDINNDQSPEVLAVENAIIDESGNISNTTNTNNDESTIISSPNRMTTRSQTNSAPSSSRNTNSDTNTTTTTSSGSGNSKLKTNTSTSSVTTANTLLDSYVDLVVNNGIYYYKATGEVFTVGDFMELKYKSKIPGLANGENIATMANTSGLNVPIRNASTKTSSKMHDPIKPSSVGKSGEKINAYALTPEIQQELELTYNQLSKIPLCEIFFNTLPYFLMEFRWENVMVNKNIKLRESKRTWQRRKALFALFEYWRDKSITKRGFKNFTIYHSVKEMESYRIFLSRSVSWFYNHITLLKVILFDLCENSDSQWREWMFPKNCTLPGLKDDDVTENLNKLLNFYFEQQESVPSSVPKLKTTEVNSIVDNGGVGNKNKENGHGSNVNDGSTVEDAKTSENINNSTTTIPTTSVTIDATDSTSVTNTTPVTNTTNI